jgi:hypothetical protein
MATRHREAFNALVPLKAEWRELTASFEDLDERRCLEFTRRSALILRSLIPIPDSQFNWLKARHYSKVMVSKLISDHPGGSVVFLRLYLWWRGTWKGIKDAARKSNRDVK